MNLIAIDIGNSNINVGLFLKDKQESVECVPGSNANKLAGLLKTLWEKVPVARRSKEGKRDGRIIVSSVRPAWTEVVRKTVGDKLDEKILLIPKDVPYPVDISVKEPQKVGSDRILSSAAAYAVVEKAVVVADFGSAVTIDLVDDRGVFCGGVIFPGFDMSAEALEEKTAQLPKVKIKKPKCPFGRNTTEAIQAGLYYSAIGTLEVVVRLYAEKIGTWPQTVLTGTGAEIIKDDCEFVDSYVPNLVVKGIALAYRKFLEAKQ